MIRGFIILVLLAMMNSCDLINEDLPECVQSVKFVYNMTLSGGDAFNAQVGSVDLYVFDDKGNFVKKYSESGDALKDPNYRLRLDLADGNYTVAAWCGMMDNGFSLNSFNTLKEMQNAIRDVQGGVSSTDLKDMWYGLQEITVNANEAATHKMNLTKNTNNIRVMLQNVDGRTINGNDFEFKIIDNNMVVDWQNNPSTSIIYNPFAQGTSQVGGDENNAPVQVAYAEFSTSRLYVGNNTRLVITNKENGQIVLDIPLLDYLTMRSEKYKKMSDQEYLDRECDYTLVLFLGDNNTWLRTTIIINGWTVRINNI